MLNFFYDSIETLKKVKKPTNADVINLTIIIFLVVIIAALLFALMDWIFGEAYNMIYEGLSSMLGWGNSGAAAVADLVPSVEINPAEVVIDADVAPTPSAVEAAIEVQPSVDVAE